MQERLVVTYHCASLGAIPSLNEINEIPRSKVMKIILDKQIIHDRQAEIATYLKENLHGFLVGFSAQKSEITIGKLISDSEVEQHQLFFEQCAKNYRKITTRLMNALAQHLEIQIDQHPLETFNPLKLIPSKSKGHMGDWHYYLHGFHIGCENKKTKQCIEIPLVYGHEYGALDPYFFSKFIKSTPEYQPLPVAIYEDYHDGEIIINKMISLGKFEWVNSNISGLREAVVTDRDQRILKKNK